MSKASDQALVLLAVTAGVLETIRMGRCFAKVDLQLAVAESFDAAQKAIIAWPGMNNRAWIKSRRESFMAYVEQLSKESYPAVELVKMVEQILTDLSDIYTVNPKKSLISAIIPGVEALSVHVDRDGANFQAFETSGEIIDRLYQIVEMDL